MSNKDNQKKINEISTTNHIQKSGEDIMNQIRLNAEKNQESRKNDSKFLAIQAGEKLTLEFTGNFGPVQQTFKDPKSGEDKSVIRYSYDVVVLERKEEGIKTWNISKKWSNVVDNYLSEGFLTLRVQRDGSSMNDTNYLFIPVGASIKAQAAS